ncbi:diguanylate cyclase domain-containing protein [Pandoraea terrae]|uniref:sensor domain-containing diguanylate cyclase n=1 Tax=Pandoraea terrae TaxID=1537710 RepID=UPI001CD562BB|nr:diguanylate cyclase [Pandoraea terrae]
MSAANGEEAMVRWSLKSRLVASTVIVVAVLIVLLFVVARHFAYAQLRHVLQAQQDTQVRLVAEQLDDKFEERATILHHVAAQLAPMLGRSPAELKAFAATTAAIPHIFNWVFLAGTDGSRIFDSRLTGEQANFSDREYFRKILRGDELAISEPLTTRLTGAPGVIMAVPVRAADGRLLAMLAGGLNLQQANFLLDLSNNRIGATGIYCLITTGPSRRYVMHPTGAMVLQPESAQGDACGLAEADSAWSFGGLAQPVVARQILRTSGWELIAVLPPKEAFSPLTQTRPKVIVTVLGALLLTGLAVWLVIRWLLKPLDQLHRVVRRSASDPRAYTCLPAGKPDEIGELSLAFSHLMRQLLERNAALQNAKEVAETRAKYIQTIANHVPDLISYLDTHERYVFVNAAYERRFNLSANQIVGRTLRDLWGDEIYLSTLAKRIRQALAGEVVNFSVEWREDSTTQIFDVTYQPVANADSGPVVGIHVFVRDVTQERMKVEHLEQKMMSDHLTGLLNRTGFEQRLASAMAAAERDRQKVALLLIDLDNFKLVNDTYGHAFGDALLTLFARRLKSCARGADVVARIGGDEFAVILAGFPSEKTVERIAGDIVNHCAQSYEIYGLNLQCGATVGAASHLGDRQISRNELFLKADTALYAAKNAGKARFALFPLLDAPDATPCPGDPS